MIFMNTKPELGILFIHGIGEQRVGQTLTDFGEPLCEWLKGWLSNDKRDSASEGGTGVVISKAILYRPELQVCPHFFADLRIKNENEIEQKTWLFAESHWAESFPSPGTQEVTLWLMRVVPWTCLSYAGRRVKSAMHAFGDSFVQGKWFLGIGKILSLLMHCLMSFLLLGLSWLLELLLIVLILIGSLPIPAIRSYVSWVQEKITAVIGDSYVFASSVVRRESVIEQVRSDIDWVGEHCDKVVIVAHSQGAAIAYLALNKALPQKLRLLITFGSGISKLSQLTQSRIRTYMSLIAFYSPMAFLFVGSYIAETLGLLPQEDVYAGSIWVTAAMFVFISIASLKLSMIESNDDIKNFGEKLEKHRIGWLDIFSSADPVPNGPLFLSRQSFLDSVKIYNERSIFTDHTTYRANREGFLSTIVNTLVKCGVTSLPIVNWNSGYDQLALEYGREARRIRTSAFQLTRLLLLASLVIVVFDDQAATFLGTKISTWINWICETFYGQLGSGNITKCWTISAFKTGIIAFGVIYLAVTKLVRLIEKGISGSFIGAVYRGSPITLQLSAVMPALVFLFVFVFGYSAFSLAVHLYFPKTFQLTRLIVNAIPNVSGYLDWQAYFFGLAGALVTAIVYMFWSVQSLRRLCIEHGLPAKGKFK